MGCTYAHLMSNKNDKTKVGICAFCRTLTSDKDELRKRKKERIEANDPPSLCFVGIECYEEEGGYDKALEYLTKAAELGDIEAHYQLGRMYMEGGGVKKDSEKAVYHLEKAAISGHPNARSRLGCIEGENGNMEKVVKHLVIAANLGHEGSMKALLTFYKEGYITKEDYGATLRTHQDAIDATKSEQRDQVENFLAKMGL